jgi:hypothetical protein
MVSRFSLLSRAGVIAMVILPTTVSSAQAAFFDLLDTSIETKDEALSFMHSVGGITATLTAVVGVGGDLNQASSEFGINATGSGDDTSQLDGDNGDEAVDITFNVPVFFTQVEVSLFGSNDLGRVTIATESPVDITTTGATDFLANNFVPLGQTVTVAYVAGTIGNGFSFDSFTVVAVPEPTTAALLAASALSVGMIWRRGSSHSRRRRQRHSEPGAVSHIRQW